MRFSQRLKKESTPQWWDCYIHYQHLKMLLKMIKVSAEDRIQFEKVIFQNQIGNKPYIPKYIQAQTLMVPVQHHGRYIALRQNNEAANIKFLEFLKKQQQLFLFFANHKIKQLQMRFTKAVSYSSLVKQDEKLIEKILLPYLQDLFSQSTNLSQMYESNVEAERRIITRYQLETLGYFPTPQIVIPQSFNINRLNMLSRQIQDYYCKVSPKNEERSRKRIRMLTRQKQNTTKDSLIIGVMIGAFVAACAFLAALLIYLRNYVQTDPIFNNDFPTWRGITLFIIFIWILGINLHHYEKFNVNHRIILENDSVKYPRSTSFFKIAGFFSVLLVILFTLYTLDIADAIVIYGINSQFFPLFVWVPFIIFLINPISIFIWKSRKYIVTTLYHSLISWVIPITYPIVYMTDLFLSILVPIQDFIYTICYYANFRNTSDQQQQLQANDCAYPVALAIFIFSLIIFVYRIMQCIKCGLQVKPYNILDFFNAGKYTVAMVSSILSYYLAYNRDSIFPAWVVFGVLTSIYTYYWDIKYDWLLLQKGTYRFLLRDKIIYDKRMYYILLFVNLLLRISWVLTISTNIVNNFAGSSQIFVLLFSFLELLRRGVWNMLSVEAQQVKNYYQLNALPQSFNVYDKKIEETLIAQKERLTNVSVQRLVQNEMSSTHWSPLAEQINKEQFLLIKQKIKQKKLNVKQIKFFMKENSKHNIELFNYFHRNN